MSCSGPTPKRLNTMRSVRSSTNWRRSKQWVECNSHRTPNLSFTHAKLSTTCFPSTSGDTCCVSISISYRDRGMCIDDHTDYGFKNLFLVCSSRNSWNWARCYIDSFWRICLLCSRQRRASWSIHLVNSPTITQLNFSVPIVH